MVRVKIRNKTPATSPGNGSKKGARIPRGGSVQPDQPIVRQVQKEKGILQRMLEIISDEIHGRDREIMLESEESWNDWKGQF